MRKLLKGSKMGVKRKSVGLIFLGIFLCAGIALAAGPPKVLANNPNFIIWVFGVCMTSFLVVNGFLGFFLKQHISQQGLAIEQLFTLRNADHDNLTKLIVQHDCVLSRKKRCENCDALTRVEVKAMLSRHD